MLYFLNLAPILKLINFLLHLKKLISLNPQQPPRPLDFVSCLITHSFYCAPEVLYFQKVSNEDKGQHLPLSHIIFYLPEVLEDEVHV